MHSISKTILAITFLSLLLLSPILTAQESEISQDKPIHEVKLNTFYLFDVLIELEYEYVFKKSNTSLGVSIGKSFGGSQDVNFEILPFYRWFFNQKPGEGFFLEAHGIIFDEDNTYYYYLDNYITAVGAGISIGTKFIRRKGFAAEVVIGMGRIFNDYRGNWEPIYPRLALNLGKRF